MSLLTLRFGNGLKGMMCSYYDWIIPPAHSYSLSRAYPRFQVYDDHKTEKYLASGRFDLFAALSFPDADLTHLETCLAFLLWAFTVNIFLVLSKNVILMFKSSLPRPMTSLMKVIFNASLKKCKVATMYPASYFTTSALHDPNILTRRCSGSKSSPITLQCVTLTPWLLASCDVFKWLEHSACIIGILVNP